MSKSDNETLFMAVEVWLHWDLLLAELDLASIIVYLSIFALILPPN